MNHFESNWIYLNFGLDILDGIRSFNLKSDGFAGQSLDEDLHSTAKSQNQMESRFLLDIVIRQGSSILQLLAGEDESLLVWGDSLLVLNILGNRLFKNCLCK